MPGPRIDQHAFALFLARGELDRHLRRMRARYRLRRDLLVAALADPHQRSVTAIRTLDVAPT